MITDAKYLSKGDKYRVGNKIFEVSKIESITYKSITFRTNRIYPDFYKGNFFNRKSLISKIEIVK